MSESDSSNESIDQMEMLKNADVKPGFAVSGWEDDTNELIEEEQNPYETPEKTILFAASENNLELVKEVLTKKPSTVSAVDDDGYTPLHKACYNNNVDMAKLLLRYGADPNAVTEFRWTPLHSAAKWSHAECGALLLQHGANVNALSDGDQTPLHVAATVSNCRNMATVLLSDPRINCELLNNSGETAFLIAKRTGMTHPIFEMGHSAFSVETGFIE